MSHERVPDRGRVTGFAGQTLALVGVVIVGLLAGLGWLYALRGLNWFSAGPSIGDSLPLLQLAGFDGQPLLRVVVAWLLVGVLAGVALSWVPRPRRTLFAGLFALALLLLASQASYALARNLRFTSILFARAPGAGPWLEALLFTVGCALPGRAVAGAKRRRIRRVAPASLLGASSELDVGGGQDGDAAEDDGDRGRVREDCDRVRA
jgi:hypothetical protein